MSKKQQEIVDSIIRPSKKVTPPNYGMSLDECRRFIDEQDTKDKEKLKQAMDGDCLHWTLLEDAARAMKKRSMLLYHIREIAEVIANDSTKL